VRLQPALPDPAGYVPVGLSAGRDLARLAARASATVDPAARWAAWRKVDGAVTGRGFWIPISTPQRVEPMSARVGSVTVHPLYGAPWTTAAIRS
jgi:ABC-type transport system substrate-binding protein